MKDIMQKYNIRAPRYTSYPPATEFTETGFAREDCRRILSASNEHYPKNISIYLHIPFCPQTCHFCGCNSYLKKSEEQSEKYVDALLKEIDLVFTQIDLDRSVSQIHWGGGTPNALSFTLIGKIMDALQRKIHLSDQAEIAMECNPAYLKPKHIKDLRSMGFNRLSLGIQDFDKNVLKAVNREPSAMPMEKLLELIRAEDFHGVNFDLIYGLPLQSPESFLKNLDQAIQLRPDRLVTFSYAHVPWVREGQKKLESLSFPTPEDKLDMFLGGMDKMISSGYRMIGMDHYALPDDILGKASDKGRLHRNFQGYCTRETTGQVYAFGASAISQLERAYIQNVRHPEKYVQAINENSNAVQRGYELSDSEILIRTGITELMCNGKIDFTAIGIENQMALESVKKIFDYNPEHFADLQADGLVVANNQGLSLSSTGKLLSRVVAMRLDPIQNGESQVYSKTI